METAGAPWPDHPHDRLHRGPGPWARQPAAAEMVTLTGVLSDVDGGTALEREFVVPPGTVQLDLTSNAVYVQD